MRLYDLAELLGATLENGTPDLEITGVASIQEARAGDLTFFSNPRYINQLRTSAASAVIVPSTLAEEIAPVPIRVSNPSAAFASVVSAFAPPEVLPEPGIHPTAVIAPTAVFGEGVCIGAFSVIEEGVTIGAGSVIGAGTFIGRETRLGAGCTIHPNVTIRERTLLGNRVILQSGVVVGSCGFGYEFREGRHQKIPQTGIVEIGDDVEIGANSTVDRARFGRTVIGEGTKIDNLVQIAHNVQIGAHTIICAQVGISGSTRIGSYVTLAGQVGVAGHLEIGNKATVGAKAGVTKNVAPGSTLIGAPARPIKEFKETNFYVSQLRKLFSRVKELERKAGE